ncbi:MAG: potassium channel family protein [Saprospiraceae bacterium]
MKQVKNKLSIPEVRRFEFYTLPRTILSNRVAVFLLIIEFLFGMGGYMYLEGYNWREAFYMVVITISTVGYGEVYPLSEDGQLFTSILIVINFGVFAYVLSVFSYYVINGEIFKKMHLKLIGNKVDQLRNHVIVCGYGRYGNEVAQHFLDHKLPFVIIESDEAVIEEIQKNGKKVLYIQEDATQDETLMKAGIKNAKALVSALPDDSENLFIVLTARQMNPQLDIISRAASIRSQRKLQLAGANHVIMPEQIGGFYMATLVTKPGATEFFSYITREYESDIEFEELSYSDMPNSCREKSISDLHIRKETGTNIIGFKHPDGSYVVNPGPETRLVENSSFIVLGTKEQLERLRIYLQHIE